MNLDKTNSEDFPPYLVHLLWITGRTFGRDLCQTTQIQVANALKRQGVKVTFVSPGYEDAEHFVNSEGHGFTPNIIISKIPGFKSITFERELRKKLPQILVENRPDVAVCDWRGARGAWKALQEANIAWAMVDRGPPAYRTPLGRLQWLHYDRSWKSAGRRAAVCMTVSKAHKEFIKARFSLQNKIITLPAAADPNTFAAGEHANRSGRPGVDRPLRIVYHGRLDRSRNVEKLVKVADQLIGSGIDTELLMFGAGTSERKLRKLSSSNNWLKVIPAQPFSKVPTLLAKMDVGLLPMGNKLVWRTASPLKLFEYAASNLPIVATDIEAHRLEGGPEWIALVSDNQLVDGMVRKLQSWVVEEKIAILGKSARKELVEKYTWDHAIKPALEVLKQISEVKLGE